MPSWHKPEVKGKSSILDLSWHCGASPASPLHWWGDGTRQSRALASPAPCPAAEWPLSPLSHGPGRGSTPRATVAPCCRLCTSGTDGLGLKGCQGSWVHGWRGLCLPPGKGRPGCPQPWHGLQPTGPQPSTPAPSRPRHQEEVRRSLPPLTAEEGSPWQVTAPMHWQQSCARAAQAGQGQRRLQEEGDGSHRQPWHDGGAAGPPQHSSTPD